MPNLELFIPEQQRRTRSSGADLEEAERLLLELADYVYTHTALKPMSKTLFVLSRCLLAAPGRKGDKPADLARCYARSLAALGTRPLHDDFDLSVILHECERHLPHILSVCDRVRALCAGSDCLGLAFNTLLRGKWEGGEGLGTHLTPEEVVAAMAEMVFSSEPRPRPEHSGRNDHLPLFGDPCGGTGRFVLAFANALRERGIAPERIGEMLRLYDQSSLSVDMARLNFSFEGMRSSFKRVGDSLTAPEVTAEAECYSAIATNPPFGSGKYRWSRELEVAINRRLLRLLGLEGPGDTCDPSAVFFLRCLDLLATGGVLAIVLPDGVLHSRKFRRLLDGYEAESGQCVLELLALVSLPAATFSLGGTVAKTSFVVMRKTDQPGDGSVYVGKVGHIGFRKRGNRRVEDPLGNDLIEVVRDYRYRQSKQGTWTEGWRSAKRLIPSTLQGGSSGARMRDRAGGPLLSSIARLHRERGLTDAGGREPWYHVSVLDIDRTGAIDVVKAAGNRPATQPQACRTGDVLMSCINPRIWRVSVVPNLVGNWTCSTEFAVLRPRDGIDPWELALRLHHGSVMATVAGLATGTSSSRQRVDKKSLLRDVVVPEVDVDAGTLAEYVRYREAVYRFRIDEDRALGRLHEGKGTFLLGRGYGEGRHSPLTSAAGSKERTS